MVNTAELVVSLPQPSVAVKITVALPVSPQSSDKLVKSFIHVTVLHSSVASAPPFAANHAFNSAKLPAPSHSTVSSID